MQSISGKGLFSRINPQRLALSFVSRLFCKKNPVSTICSLFFAPFDFWFSEMSRHPFHLLRLA